jgi:hypothetical protein
MKKYVFLTIMLSAPLHSMLKMPHDMMKGLNRATSYPRRYVLSVSPFSSDFVDTGWDKPIKEYITKPRFDMQEAERLIKATPQLEPTAFHKNMLIDFIVFRATQFGRKMPTLDQKYAQVLDLLRNNGYGYTDYVPQFPLHEAVKSDLPAVTAALLHYKNLINKPDFDNCTPLFYAQSYDIAQKLIAAGADIYTVDKHANTPLHTVKAPALQALLDHNATQNPRFLQLFEEKNDTIIRISGTYLFLTPLRKAIFEGDFDKYTMLAKRWESMHADQEREHTYLRAIAKLQFDRTGNEIFKVIDSHMNASRES